MLYFKYSLTFVNPLITNLSVFFMIFSLMFLIVYGILISNKSGEIYLFFIPSIIFAFIIRSVPNLILSYPPLQDPYFYIVNSLNIINNGTINPVLNSWYPEMNFQLQWPLMHILNSSLFFITNIDFMQLFRFQEPFMGVIFFLGVFILAKVATKNDKISIIAALIATFSDVIIFYQSEYHPQGFAFVFFAFLLYSFLKSSSTDKTNIKLISLIFLIAFIFSHHFSSLFIGFICILYLVYYKIFSIMPIIKKVFKKFSLNLKKDVQFFALIIVGSLAYHFNVKYSVLGQFIGISNMNTPPMTLVSMGNSIPLYVTILNSTKLIVLFLALVSILWIFTTKNMNEIRLAIFSLCILSAGVISKFVVYGPVDRFIGLYIILVCIFVSIALYNFYSRHFKLLKNYSVSLTNNKRIFVVALLTSIILISGIFNSQSPAYFFKDTGANDYYWYSNVLPEMGEYKAVGDWINCSILPESKLNSKFGTTFDTTIVPFYFGLVNYYNIEGVNDSKSFNNSSNSRYLLINPKIPCKNLTNSEYGGYNILYDNGINLYSN